MMYVWLTEYIADTAGFVYQQAGMLNYNVTPNMVSTLYSIATTQYLKAHVVFYDWEYRQLFAEQLSMTIMIIFPDG